MKTKLREFNDLPVNCPNSRVGSGKLPVFIRKNHLKNLLFPIIKLISLIWFLVRAIPKLTRASYPCQRAAMHLASGFILGLVGFVTSSLVYRRVRKWRKQNRSAILLLVMMLVGPAYCYR